MELVYIYIVLSAFILDTLLGDPRGIPHLIVGYGNLISFFEKQLNKDTERLMKGAFMTTGLVFAAYLVPLFILELTRGYLLNIPYAIISCILLFYCIANRTLIDEGIAVFKELEISLEKGRKRLSWIVGRETNQLSEQQIRTATFETMSENLSDGVIAPLFYFLLFGIPGAMAYKMINTLDSMIGYRNERYEKFGKFAAKSDDFVNYLPARITAFLILIVSGKLRGLSFVMTEGKKHKSPNAGFPEAALAYVLDTQFGGPNYYNGQLVDKPFIGGNPRKIQSHEIRKVVRINFMATSLFICIIVALQWMLYSL